MLGTIGMALGGAGSLFGGLSAAKKQQQQYSNDKARVDRSARSQTYIVNNAYGAAEPLIAGNLKGAREGATMLRGALGSGQESVAREATKRAEKDTADLEGNAKNAGLDFSSTLDNAKRAIAGDVNRDMLSLELALNESIAQVESAAQGMESGAASGLAQVKLDRASALSDIERWRLNTRMGIASPAPTQPNFAGLAAGLFGVPGKDQMQQGLLGSLLKKPSKSAVL